MPKKQQKTEMSLGMLQAALEAGINDLFLDDLIFPIGMFQYKLEFRGNGSGAGRGMGGEGGPSSGGGASGDSKGGTATGSDQSL